MPDPGLWGGGSGLEPQDGLSREMPDPGLWGGGSGLEPQDGLSHRFNLRDVA